MTIGKKVLYLEFGCVTGRRKSANHQNTSVSSLRPERSLGRTTETHLPTLASRNQRTYCLRYHKISILSPGLIFVQKSFGGLNFGELIFGVAYYWREFCVSKWVGFDNKNGSKHEDNSYSLKQLKTASLNSPWAFIGEGLLFAGYLRLRFRGLIFGRV